MTEAGKFLRPVRSFVRRESRMTASQERALTELWPRYGVDLGEHSLGLSALFGRSAPCVLEIGFGNGEALLAAASANPQQNYLGVEVHRPGVGHLLRELSVRNISNVRVACADVNDVLACLPDETLSTICLFFPDPWPKKRHHKRRLVQPAFMATLHRKLARDGLFCVATDWEDYARHVLEVMAQMPQFENVAGAALYTARPLLRPFTKFERRGERLGHVVRDLAFRRIG